MSNSLKIGIVVVVIILAAPLLMKLAQEGGSKESAEPGKAAADGKTDAKKGAKGGAPAAPAAPLEAPQLNAQNLANTVWQIPISGMPVTVSFLPGGAAVAQSPMLKQLTGQDQLSGTWTVSGASLTVSASLQGQSKSQTLQISGTQLIANGKPVQRIQ